MAWDYKLAEKLKSAGYPQKVPKGENYFEWVKNHTHVPNLYELVLACGPKFRTLSRVGDQWNDWEASYENEEGAEFVLSADNPTEAVANVWLSMKEDKE